MSETPRTDAKHVAEENYDCHEFLVPADFARQIERELAEARAELARAMRLVEAVKAWRGNRNPYSLDFCLEEWEAGR